MADFDFMPHNDHLLVPAFGSEQVNLQSSDFLRNMFNMPLPTNDAPLTVSTDASLLLPAHQIVSPAGTNSSGPSSPTAGPFTPTQPHPGFGFPGLPNNMYNPDTQMQAEANLQMQNFELSGYSWPTSAWQDETSMGMLHNDFDLNSIPSLEMGSSKYIEEYVASPQAMALGDYSQEYPGEFMAEYQPDYVQYEQDQYLEGQQGTESTNF